MATKIEEELQTLKRELKRNQDNLKGLKSEEDRKKAEFERAVKKTEVLEQEIAAQQQSLERLGREVEMFLKEQQKK